MTIQDNILTAEEGKVLTNGSTYSKQVWLGINDSVDNWHEVDESEAEELTDSEALQIITEGE
jgi:hypothetical protein